MQEVNPLINSESLLSEIQRQLNTVGRQQQLVRIGILKGETHQADFPFLKIICLQQQLLTQVKQLLITADIMSHGATAGDYSEVGILDLQRERPGQKFLLLYRIPKIPYLVSTVQNQPFLQA